ncbi:hypothetical protein HNV12_14850 [Methanococcoides sp. SA1]|nr:hypothetical protein [Methanococcoides sp. SA1]
MFIHNSSEAIFNGIYTFDIITIIISIFAISISILGYVNNRKNLKMNEKKLELVMQKQAHKEEFESLLKNLKQTSDKLKEIPDYLYIGYLDDFISSIVREVYENKELDLLLEFTYLQINDKVAVNAIDDKRFLEQLIKEYIADLQEHNLGGGMYYISKRTKK